MKRLLSLALVCLLGTGSAFAQSTPNGTPIGVSGRDAGGRNANPPVTNPEPVTLVALAGGAAVAGGLLRRRRKAA
jgi:hypothetical protein